MDRGVIFGALVVWVIILLFFRSHRNWLPYYVLGSVGLAFALIGVGRLFFLEQFLQVSTASIVHLLSAVTGVETRLFPAVPGALMVLVIPQNLGWTVLNIGLESSGLLEIGVLTGMVGFYPGWTLKRRILTICVGVFATYVANVVRVSFIVASLHWGGKDLLFISHTIGGRLIFFVLVVLIFWFVLSLPTLRTVHKNVQSWESK
ncbi:MAG: exosortase/archaeosortase family protein [Dehalococcoidia bacterium]|nr:exosortase/archaeosortase family protein [Dehalococcoidia bacterium]